MKKLLFVLALSFITINGYSQFGIGFGMGGFGWGGGMGVPLNRGNGQRSSQNIEKHVQQMRSDLNLDNGQTVKVRSLFIERQRRYRGSDPMGNEEYNQRLQQILTPDQNTRLAILRQQAQPKNQQQPPPGNGSNQSPPPPAQKGDDDLYH